RCGRYSRYTPRAASWREPTHRPSQLLLGERAFANHEGRGRGAIHDGRRGHVAEDPAVQDEELALLYRSAEERRDLFHPRRRGLPREIGRGRRERAVEQLDQPRDALMR